jgi:hypothetical protein
VSCYNESSYAIELCFRIYEILLTSGNQSCLIGDVNQSPYSRPVTAKEAGCKLYIALHSGLCYDHRTMGTVCFYHPEDNLSFQMANKFAKTLTAICPIKPTDGESVQDGTRIYGKSSLIEIQKPYELGMTPILIEVNVHDDPDTCQWLICSLDIIAESIANVIRETRQS